MNMLPVNNGVADEEAIEHGDTKRDGCARVPSRGLYNPWTLVSP